MPKRNRLYPHLLPPDVPVWERYLASFGEDYETIDYDVRVGQGRPAGEEIPENLHGMALDLSRRRIDAVGVTADRIDLIEVTRIADLKAVGQLIAYPILYKQSFKPLLPVRMILVAEQTWTDIDLVLESMDVRVFLLNAL